MVKSVKYSFNLYNEYSADGICQSISNINGKNLRPIIVCIGSDLVLGDSLGPLIGTILKNKGCNAFIYGTLNCPITAKEVEYVKTYIKKMHESSFIIAVDAAVGDEEDVGLIRVIDRGLKPGLGVNKNLSEIGDASIIGIVAKKTAQNYDLYNATRLNLVYKMAEKISDGIENYVNVYKERELIS